MAVHVAFRIPGVVSGQNLGYLKPGVFQGYFPYLKATNPASLSKISNPNDKFRQTVGRDSGKRRLFGLEISLESLFVALLRNTRGRILIVNY
jgi:hypothetical protein